MGAGESGRGLCPVCRVRKAHSSECEGERAAGNEEEVGVGWARARQRCEQGEAQLVTGPCVWRMTEGFSRAWL